MSVTVQTTLEKFAGARVPNYSTAPTIDVEILPDVFHCAADGAEVDYSRDVNRWHHLEATTCVAKTQSYPRPRCRYCRTDDPDHLSATQYAWYDATECSRCGGVEGYALGD